MSVCADEIKDHLCDICNIALSYCIDENENYSCDYCGRPTPTVTVTVDEGCLVNGAAEAYKYEFNNVGIFAFSYEGNDGRVVDHWLVYDLNGNLICRVEKDEFYTVSGVGKFHAKPVFADN
jgi:hypothetical protein